MKGSFIVALIVGQKLLRPEQMSLSEKVEIVAAGERANLVAQ